MSGITMSGLTTVVEQKKKGRKPKNKNYFDVEQEVAVINFLAATSFDERNRIYNEWLREPIDKMISSIIRRYKLYPKGIEIKEIHDDTHSFLMTKMEKFKPSKEKKAYSYFGTICKNYLMGQIQKDQKELTRKISYEDISTDLENSEVYSYSIDNDNYDSEQIIKYYLVELNKVLKNNNLNENEKKLGFALHDLFENYDKIFIETNNNKYNKNLILLYLREMTNLSTKEIRSAIKKYKVVYYNIIEKMIK